MYRLSQRLAWAAGVVIPLGETMRRWGTWWDVPAAYLDDLVIGAFFLFGAWMSRRSSPVGARCLAAAYGCGCGIGFLSVAFAVTAINQTDPAGVSGVTALIVKVVMVSIGLAGLVGALRGPETTQADRASK
jgi:peptidoglycan/LPS O-acetylase OafA/YrhL